MYSVKYKVRGSLFWKRLHKVIGDGYVDNRSIRFFHLEDLSRVEVPTDGTIFVFSKERHLSIKQKMEKESGTYIP